jgi:polar amino acid transport system substrate-binding protein
MAPGVSARRRRPGTPAATARAGGSALRRLAAFGPLLLLMSLLSACARPPGESGTGSTLRWGGDAEGGAPFVEADPTTDSLRGFDVEIAAMLAEGLGRTPRFQQVTYASIAASVERGDVDVGLSGVEDRPDLRARHSLSLPYFEFREVLAVRAPDSARYRTLADLRGRRVGTLGATLAYDMLLEAQQAHGVVPVSYDDDVHPYTDLADGRLDAVLLDHVIAERALRRTGGFVIRPEALARGHYVAVFARADSALRDSADVVLRARMLDGTLQATFTRWNVWDDGQGAHFARVLGGAQALDADARPSGRRDGALQRYLPALLRGAGLTVLLSCLAMCLAVVLGVAVAAGRVYGPPFVRVALTVYVEVMRGTPVLLQLFVLYYGLSGVVRLPAFLAAVIGLGLNYAAYESEIYRSALLAISPQQLEAARTLGLSELQVLRLVRGPQAFRLALAPMTNDFVALLKDSSLVSVITVVELTKQTAIYATNIGSWFVPGVVCAVLYLALSLPLSHAARRLEARWSHP